MADSAAFAPSQVSVKTVLTICLTVLVVAAGVAFIVVSRTAVWLTLAAAILATALHHLVDVLTRHHVKRGWALTLTIAAFFLVIVSALMVVLPPAIRQVSALFSSLPNYVAELRQNSVYQGLENRFHFTQRLSSDTLNEVKESAEPALHALGSAVTFVAELVTVIVLAAFMMIFGGRLISALMAESLPERRLTYETVAQRVYRAVGGYTAGLGLICLINATLTTIFLAIARVPFFLPLGIASGLSSLIPYAGALSTGAVIMLIALVTKGVWAAVATGIYFVCYGQLEGHLLGPLIFRRTVHVSPLVTLLSILFFVEAGGILGAIIAVPIAAALQIIVKEVLAMRREQRKA